MRSFLDRLGVEIAGRKGFPGFLVCAALGALGALAFAPLSVIPLYFFALALLLFRISKVSARQALVSGYAFGLGHFAAGVFWVGNSFFAQNEVPVWLAPVAVVLLAAYLSVYPALAAWIFRLRLPGSWLGRAVFFAALFTLSEYLRGVLFTGFPWNVAGSLWAAVPAMMQSASLWGVYGLGFLTVLMAGLLAALLDGGEDIRTKVKLTGGALGLFAALLAGGLIRLGGAEVSYFEGVKLRLVQANIPQKQKWDEAALASNLDLYLRMSHAGTDGLEGVDLVIWPETAVPYDVSDSSRFREYLMGELGGKAILVTGAVRQASGPSYYNSVFALGPGGEILGAYDKTHLVPFGEFMPLRPVLSAIGLSTVVPGDFDYSSGIGPVTMALPGLPPFSPLVCYEVIFPGAVTAKGERPAWLLNLTNDAWFGESAGPYQHLALARFRTVEEGLPLVRSAGTGISAVVDPYGRIVREAGLLHRAVLDSGLPKPLAEQTLFSKTGNVPLLALIIALAGYFLLALGRNSTRERKPKAN